ncbi:MAG: DUF1801 domain-containing protein [Chitinophagaceae bacterium]|nr:MAG: DUF1801 domain-containing protein [Chitinophagaceae bacterium]
MSKPAQIKTKQTAASVGDFIASLETEQKRTDTALLVKLMEKATKQKAVMWGTSMIGFGKKRYTSPATGREVDWFKIGFSPRKANLSLHLIDMARHSDALTRLGKHTLGGGCLYINKLDDVEINVLEQIIIDAAKDK